MKSEIHKKKKNNQLQSFVERRVADTSMHIEYRIE